MLARTTDVFPTGLFIFAPLAFYRAIHLLVKRTYVLEFLSSEMSAILVMLVVDIVVYGTLAQYLDLVLPRQFGVVKHPLFFLKPLKQLLCGKAKFNDRVVPPPTDEDSDVAATRAELTSKLGTSTRTPDPIEVVSLRKVYKGGKVAVENLTFSIPNGECFGLLGPNGAGKTTTISMLTGLYPPNGGSARVCGFDLRTQMDRIYDAMGVCPQFDILWPLLSVVETLMFYCKVKGVPKAEQREVSLQAADNVDLGHVPNRFVGRLSGGMKRRVSLAISLIGDPRSSSSTSRRRASTPRRSASCGHSSICSRPIG